MFHGESMVPVLFDFQIGSISKIPQFKVKNFHRELHENY